MDSLELAAKQLREQIALAEDNLYILKDVFVPTDGPIMMSEDDIKLETDRIKVFNQQF